jgi:hypothetical protein
MDSQQEVGIDEDSFERELNPGVKASAVASAGLEELEQRLHVRCRRGPAIGQPGNPR